MLSDLINKKSLFIFDLDGTVLNSEPLHAYAFLKIAEASGLEPISEEKIKEYEVKFYGKTDQEVFSLLKDEYPKHFTKSLEELTQEKSEVLKKLLKSTPLEKLETYLTPGIRKFLQELKNWHKHLALVSASENDVIEETLKQLELDTFFEKTIGNSDCYFGKPYPSPYFLCLRKFRCSNSDAVIFEDSPTGLRAASLTGAKVIRVTGNLPPNENETSKVSIQNFLY